MLAGVALTGVVALGLVAWFGQRQLVFFPDTTDPGAVSDLAPRSEDVTLTTEDGLELGAWLLRPPAASDRETAVLYAPGNGGHRGGRLDVARALASEGFTVLLVDYRGYGGNPGSPSEDGLASDARAAAAWLREHGYAGERTIYVGESIGTGVVTRLATTDPPAGVLLRSPYTSLADVAGEHYPVLPAGLLLRDRFDTLDRLPQVEAPITVLAGEADEIIPVAQSREVADRARALHDEVVLPGVGHNDAVWFGPRMAGWVADLADATVGPTGG